MAFSFANFCPHCRVAGEIFIDDATLPEGSVQVRYQCRSCKGAVTCSCSFFVSVVAVPSDGTVGYLPDKSPHEPAKVVPETSLRKSKPALASKTNGKTNGHSPSLDYRPALVAESSPEEIGTWIGHRGPVGVVTFSADQSIVVSGGHEGGIRLRRLGAEPSADLVIPKVHPGGVRLLALSPDNKMLASVAAGQEGTVYLWDLSDASPKLRALLRLPQPLANSLAFSPQVHLLAVGCGSNILYWDLNRLGHREDCILQGHTKAVSSLSFAPNGLLMASGSQDGTVCLWSTELSDPRRIVALDSSKDGVLSVAFAADGRLFASGGNDHLVHLWEYQEGNRDQLSHQTLKGHKSPVRLVLFPTEGRTLLSVDALHHVYLWDLPSRTRIRQCSLPGGPAISSVACTCDGRYLAAGKVGIVNVSRLFAKAKELVELAV